MLAPQHWLLVRGRGDRRLDPEILPDELRFHSSTRRPSVQRGDLAVCYAAGWRVVFALVEVVSDPENDPTRTRWKWRFAIRPRLALSDLREAPPVEAAGVMPRSLGRHSYVRLTPDQFEAASYAIAAASDPVRVVAAGYDAMADRFATWQRGIAGSTRADRLEELLWLLPPAPEVLELGCGAGAASTRLLAERSRLTGVDVSAEQIRRARSGVPDATFLLADFTELDFPRNSFDAVVAFYVFNHVPRKKLRALVRKVASWLRPGGLFLATYGVSDAHESLEPDWLGAPMFFSSLGADDSRALVRGAGFELVRDEVEEILEPEPDPGSARFLWLLARRQ